MKKEVKIQEETSKTRDTFALVLHGLHRGILLFLRLYHPGTKGLLLLLVHLTLSLQLSSEEVKIGSQSTHLGRQLFLIFR